jgi:UV DNA damage repair endonuclease
MIDVMTKKIGFACKVSEFNSKNEVVSIPEYNFKSTTISWLNRQSKDIAVEKLWELLHHNIGAALKSVEYVGHLEEGLRMFRLGSDCLPAYTHPDWSWFWQSPEVRAYCERGFIKVGDFARKNNVRLSMHPGQFCVLASENLGIVERSIEEFEYHVDMARWMGFGKQFQDFKINVHISGRRGPQGIIDALGRLSPEARNCITIENDEISWGIDSSLELADDLALVLDLHHNWIHTGEYIKANDDRIKKIIDSWRGVRPVVHYSVSREDYLIDHARQQLPDLHALMGSGKKKQHLRAHSDYYWNDAVNEWALSHNAWADIMCESKAKNLASFKLYDTYLDKQEKENVE